MTAHALNGFYDVFAEADYNQALIDKDIVGLMRAGLPAIKEQVSHMVSLLVSINRRTSKAGGQPLRCPGRS